MQHFREARRREVKAAILLRYNINEEAYRRRFREAVRVTGDESNRGYVIWSLSGCEGVTL